MGNGVQTHVAFQGAGHPRAYSTLAGQFHPFAGALHASVERGFQHKVTGLDLVQKPFFFLQFVYANQFFVQGDGQTGYTAQTRHVFPLSGTDGLFNGMQVIGVQPTQNLTGLTGGKGSVGIHTQLHFASPKAAADIFQKFELSIQVHTNLELDARETGLNLFYEAFLHFLLGAHPHQSVDGNAFLAPAPGRVIELQSAALEVEHGCFHAEKHGGVGTECLEGDFASLFKRTAMAGQHFGIVGYVIATEIGQWGTFANALSPFLVGQCDEPAFTGAVHSP